MAEERLQKVIAQAGIASRREAEKMILAGRVRVDGQVVTKLGTKVSSIEQVVVDNQPIERESHHTYLFHKPRGVISAVKDNKGRKTVADYFTDLPYRLYPVGRLDYDTSGLLLMTNDGELAYRLTHPKHEVYKTYRALVSGVLSNERAARLRRGVDIGGFVTSPAKVKIIKGTQHSTLVEIAIHEGKNRQVRKMFAAVGNPVQELERVAIGDIRLGHLKPGHYRKLTREEIEYLKNC